MYSMCLDELGDGDGVGGGGGGGGGATVYDYSQTVSLIHALTICLPR